MMKSLIAGLVFAMFCISIAYAQQPTTMGVTAECKGFVQNQKAMQAKMQQNDARLNHLVKKMNDATGTEKVDAMAAVVNELVQQRSEMQHTMMQMAHCTMGQATNAGTEAAGQQTPDTTNPH